jgi:hypothetical protein
MKSGYVSCVDGSLIAIPVAPSNIHWLLFLRYWSDVGYPVWVVFHRDDLHTYKGSRRYVALCTDGASPSAHARAAKLPLVEARMVISGAG